MTFTLIARCRETSKVGVCIATGSPSVGGRCIFAAAGVGAISFQATAEPRLGQLGLDLLKFGYSPQKVLEELISTDPFHEWRQVGIVDARGRAAARTGPKARNVAGHLIVDQHVVLGNRVAHEGVIQAISRGFEAAKGQSFEERLMRGIEAGGTAGGQIEGQVSSAILTYGHLPVAYVDLRVDLNVEPIAELRRILDWHQPLLDYYVERLDNPELPLHKDWLEQRNITREFSRPTKAISDV
jgi:uncharacterized Ntn-hydrolase superfamily protein